jgi:hypothetical protein
MAADLTLLCHVFLICNMYTQFRCCYEHPSVEGDVFLVSKRHYVAIFDRMFTPDIYIGKTPSLVFVHYDVIQGQNVSWVQQSQ